MNYFRAVMWQRKWLITFKITFDKNAPPPFLPAKLWSLICLAAHLDNSCHTPKSLASKPEQLHTRVSDDVRANFSRHKGSHFLTRKGERCISSATSHEHAHIEPQFHDFYCANTKASNPPKSRCLRLCLASARLQLCRAVERRKVRLPYALEKSNHM